MASFRVSHPNNGSASSSLGPSGKDARKVAFVTAPDAAGARTAAAALVDVDVTGWTATQLNATDLTPSDFAVDGLIAP